MISLVRVYRYKMGPKKIALMMRQPLAAWECEKKFEMLKPKVFNKDVIEEYATPEYKTSEMNSSSSTRYMTHDNGGRPFMVILWEKPKRVEIFEVKSDETKGHTMLVLRIECQVQEWWIGISEENEFTTFGGGYGPNFDGNSILIHVHDNEYIFVGERIFSFQPAFPIVDFKSPVGNNDVPYPYALAARGSHRRYYLFTFNVALDATIGNNVTEAQVLMMDKDPNQYYLDHHLITADRSRVVRKNGKWVEDPIMPSVHEFDGITDFRIGDERYTLGFEPVAKATADFHRMSHDMAHDVPLTGDAGDKTPRRRKKTIIAIQKRGKWYTLTSADYVDIMRRFASVVGFLPFPEVETPSNPLANPPGRWML